MPRGAQRGTELDLIFDGQRLADAAGNPLLRPGITVTKLEATNPTQVKAHVQIATDAAIGEHQLRVRTATGISELRTFYVGPFPVVESKKPNNDFHEAAADRPERDGRRHDRKRRRRLFRRSRQEGPAAHRRGQGMRLGDALFDPYVAILDTNRFELAASDDTALASRTPSRPIIAPADGTVRRPDPRDVLRRQRRQSTYLLHVGTFPRPTGDLSRSAAKCGEDVALQFIGDVAGPIPQTIKLPHRADADVSTVRRAGRADRSLAQFRPRVALPQRPGGRAEQRPKHCNALRGRASGRVQRDHRPARATSISSASRRRRARRSTSA